MTELATAAAPRAARLVARAEAIMARELLAEMIRNEFPGRIALVSSFGVEAAVLLHMVASIDPATPVLFLDTGKLFGETLRYRDALIRQLGLREVRTIQPDPARLLAEDPSGTLWRTDPDRCCLMRKVEPLADALAGFEAWINGRKRYHGGARADLPVIEVADGRIKINPLASWTAEHMAAYFAAHDLPPHPLSAEGYLSVGCLPCSDRARPGEAARDGRWRGRGKTECGIHLPSAPSTSRGED
jgi:phosphoadenosine phosphosulfate reductase